MFKFCNQCHAHWETRAGFLSDRNIRLIGYQAHLEDINRGLFLFNHTIEVCNTTLSVRVSDFLDLYKGQICTQNLFGTGECGGHCVRPSDLGACHAQCKNAHIRELLRHILEIQQGIIAFKE